MIESMKLAFADKRRYWAAPERHRLPVRGLLHQLERKGEDGRRVPVVLIEQRLGVLLCPFLEIPDVGIFIDQEEFDISQF